MPSMQGPLTSGEAQTLCGMMTGIDPERVEGLLLIISYKCDNCGHPHGRSMVSNVDPADGMHMLMQGMNEIMGIGEF